MVAFTTRAILFDLDGTLVDSAEDLRAALNVMLGELGRRAITADEVKQMIGDGVPKLVERALMAVGEDVGRKAGLTARFSEIYQANAAVLTRCYPGVAATLEILASRQFRLAVVTNKPVAAARKILRVLGLDDFFASVVGGDSLPQRKPDPAPILEAARQLGMAPGGLLMVGDNIHDVAAAHAAGMPCIAVTYGYHHQPPSTFRADFLIDRFDEIPAIVVNPMLPGQPAGGHAEPADAISSPRRLQETR